MNRKNRLPVFCLVLMLVLVLAALSGCAPKGANEPKAFTLQDGTRLHYDMDREQMEKGLGEPDRVDSESFKDGYVECFYDDDGVSIIYTPEGRTRAVKITTTEVETYGGIHLLHTKKKIELTFPKSKDLDLWSVAVFRGRVEVSYDNPYMKDSDFWIYYICTEDTKISRIILMDYEFGSGGK